MLSVVCRINRIKLFFMFRLTRAQCDIQTQGEEEKILLLHFCVLWHELLSRCRASDICLLSLLFTEQKTETSSWLCVVIMLLHMTDPLAPDTPLRFSMLSLFLLYYTSTTVPARLVFTHRGILSHNLEYNDMKIMSSKIKKILIIIKHS